MNTLILKNYRRKIFIIFLLILPGLNLLYSQERIYEFINTNWLFYKGDINQLEKSDIAWDKVNIPHTWNATDVLDDAPGYYRGVGWYKRLFEISPAMNDKLIWIFFEGANQDAEVYINNELAGKHYGGYTKFGFYISPYLIDGENLLEVKLSNAHNPDVPPVGGDLCHFGGIYRDVYLMGVNEVSFDPGFYGSNGIFVKTELLDRSNAILRINSRIRSEKECHISIVHQLYSPEGSLVSEQDKSFKIDNSQVDTFPVLIRDIPEPLLWEPENPNLYQLESILKDPANGEVLDRIVQKIGFRSLDTDNEKGIILNGNPVFIKGIGKHQDYDRMGYAVPGDILENDIRLLKETGANLVRSHYPLSLKTYEMCDQLGIMVWAKIPVMDKANYSNEFLENSKNMMQEIIYQNFNRPSIILWGYACEIFGDMDWYWPKPRDPEKQKENIIQTQKFSEEFESFVREIDPSRITGNDFHTDPTPEFYLESGLTHMNMINGWNIYQGWYHNNLDSIGWALKRFRKWNTDLPFLVAEFGAGSDPGIHTYEPTIFDFSIEYQNLFHEKYLEAMDRYPFVHGMSIWTLVDFQVENRADAVPHINSKGLLTTDRKKKDAFFLYKANWSDEPFVHIAGKGWNYRIETYTDSSKKVPVKIYSNLVEIELIQNGKSRGKKKVDNYGKAEWNIDLAAGLNHLEAIGTVEGEELIDAAEIEVEILGKNNRGLILERGELSINVGQSRTYFTDRIRNDYWIPDVLYGQNGFGHINGNYYRTWNNMKAWEGIREGTGHDIYGTDIDPVFQTFLIGVNDYRVDLKPGFYEVSFYFTEPFTKNARMDPAEKTGADAEGKRVFDILINGIKYYEDLDLAGQYGEYTSVIKRNTIKVGNKGLDLKFIGKKGVPVLSGIKIEALNH